MPNDVPKDQIQGKAQKEKRECFWIFQLDLRDLLDIFAVLIAEFYDEIGG